MMKRAFGGLSLAIGLILLAWFVYNLVRPTPEFQSGYRGLFQLALPAAMVGYGWRWLRDGGPGIETLQIDPDAPELVASVKTARRTMSEFRAAVLRNQDGAYIKFPLITDGGVREHIWAYVHHYADGVFNVSLANSPYTQKGPIEHRRDVRESEVEDWQIMTPDGRIRGAYSLRALFEHVERNGIRLNKTMRAQRAQFIEHLPEPRSD